MALKEDYLDDILDTSVNEKRKYRIINNADGTISLEDVTEYSQNGDNFGSFDINITNKTVNELIAMGLNVRCNAYGYLEVFINGLWEQTEIKALTPKTYLYKQGVFNTDLVSGWSPYNYRTDSMASSGATAISPTVTLNENNFTLSATSSGATASSFGIFATNNSIDLSNFSKLIVNVSNYNKVTNGTVAIQLTAILKDGFTRTSYVVIEQTGQTVLDISNITSSQYITFTMDVLNATTSLNISDIWLE